MNEFINFVKNNFNQISNILIVNNEKITIEDVEDLSRYIQNIYVILDNRFSYTRFFIKLRSLKNVHIINSNRIPNINYDVLSIFKYGQNEQSIISLIKTLKYIFIEYNDGTIKINNFTQISSYCFKKNKINQSFEVNDEHNEELHQKSLFIDENQNNDLKSIKDIKPIFNNIVPSTINYSSNNFLKETKFGRLDILCIISNENDVEFLKKFIKRNNYQIVKYFIMFNNFNDKGLLIKYLKSKKYIFDIFKFEEIYDKELLFKIFDLLSSGEYKYDMKTYNFMLGEVNED